MKHYKSKSFIRKIEMNLANVSVKPTDKFQLVKAYYDIDLFDCELCGHKNCMHAYEVKNLETGKIIKVGSECIQHYEDFGVDINLAKGLMRRVTSASNKARRDLKKRLGEKAFKALSEEEKKSVPRYLYRDKIEELGKAEYKKLSKEEKRELVVTEFLTLQTKELLADVASNKSILTEEDVELILQLDMKEEMEKAIQHQKVVTIRAQVRVIEDEIVEVIREGTFAGLKEKVDEAKIKIKKLNPLHPMNWIENAYNNRIAEEERNNRINKEFDWLINYDGNNPTVRDIQAYLNKNRYISPAQQNLAFSLVEGEHQPKDMDFDRKIEQLHNEPYNHFVDSVYRQYKRKGYVSEKQKAAILKVYDKEHAGVN